jgi:hypothetical protein
VPNAYNRWTRSEQHRLAIELIRQGRLRTDGPISHRVPAEQALGLFGALAVRPQEHLGVLIQWQEPQRRSEPWKASRQGRQDQTYPA